MHNPGMIYGYARVSTAAQDETGQVRQLKAAGCEKVFREKITGTTADRPQLAKLMKSLSAGEVVITPAVDRLSRDTTDLLVIARDMQRAGAGIRSLAEPFLDTTSDFAEIIFAILGVAAKLERRRILERTAAAGPTPRPTGSSSAANRSSRRTSRKRPASASKLARRSAASRAPTMSVRVRFRG
jgi:DNA invertase Pin-like site-specific DNA recombinase